MIAHSFLQSPAAQSEGATASAFIALSNRLERTRSIVDRRLTQAAKWAGPVSRELRGRGRHQSRIRQRAADAFNWLGELASRGHGRIDADLCLNLHDYLTASEDSGVRSGVLRTNGVRIGPKNDFPQASDVPFLLDDLLAQSECCGGPAAVRSAALHLDFMLLHPFADGNGRVARLLAAFILQQNGFRSTVLTAVDQHIGVRPAQYGLSLRDVHTGAMTRLDWIRRAVELMIEHAEPVVVFRDRLDRLSRACTQLGLKGAEELEAIVEFDFRGGGPLEEIAGREQPRWRDFVARLSADKRRRMAWQLERLHSEESREGVVESSTSTPPLDLYVRSL